MTKSNKYLNKCMDLTMALLFRFIITHLAKVLDKMRVKRPNKPENEGLGQNPKKILGKGVVLYV